jgi:hypothetical protein
VAIQMRIDIFCPNWSHGLNASAKVLLSSIGASFGARASCRLIMMPWRSYEPGASVNPEIARNLGDVAIFMERVFKAPFLGDYQRRILFPNPEWLDPASVAATREVIDTIAHKTRYSLAVLSKAFPALSHQYVGFTSMDPERTVGDYEAFAHFRGKAETRHTRSLIDIWAKDRTLPPIHVQAYGPDVGLDIGSWLSDGRINMFLGKFATDDAYFDSISRFGMHLCTSQVEGFGHYINEARAMRALTITLDAPPMNELVTEECGLLVRSSSKLPANLGTRFLASAEDLRAAIHRALSLSVAERKARGRAARHAYEQGRDAFQEGLRAVLS